VLALFLVAASVGVSNLAAAIGFGAGGIDRGTRLRVAAIFGLLEAGMPIVGLLMGHGLAGAVGREARWLAAVMLAAVGSYGIVKAWRQGRAAVAGTPAGPAPDAPVSGPAGLGPDAPVSGPAGLGPDAPVSGPAGLGPDAGVSGPADQVRNQPHRGRQQSMQLMASGLALSLDNLVAGFALGAYQVSILTGAAVFGTVSVVMSLAGLELGARIGHRSGQRGEVIGGVVLIGVGVAIGLGAIG
jgi:putative Mn2+ efflux pump MntP